MQRMHRAVKEDPSLHRVAKRVRGGHVRFDSALRRDVGKPFTLQPAKGPLTVRDGRCERADDEL